VELVRAAQKLIHVERGLSRGSARRFGSHAREESRGGGPDTRSLALFGCEHTTKERYRRVMFAVSVVQFAEEIIAPSFVDARGELPQ
jgi:hypothetical protein